MAPAKAVRGPPLQPAPYTTVRWRAAFDGAAKPQVTVHRMGSDADGCGWSDEGEIRSQSGPREPANVTKRSPVAAARMLPPGIHPITTPPRDVVARARVSTPVYALL